MRFEKHLNGKMPLTSHSDMLFLMDESLTPNVAKALRLVEYDAVTIREAFQGRSRVLDPEIIEWCKNYGAVWIYADDRARKQHKKQMLAAGIRSLWIYRPKGGMSSKEELRILAYVLPNLIDMYEKQRRILHYRASAHGEPSRPRIRLTPSPL